MMVVWDAMKAYLRGVVIKEISKIKLATRQREELIMQRVKQTQQEFRLDPIEEKCAVWQEAQKIYKDTVMIKAENSRFLQCQKHYEMGEQVLKWGNMLALIAHNQEGPSSIVAIADKKGAVMHATESFQRIFVDFYSRLYQKC